MPVNKTECSWMRCDACGQNVVPMDEMQCLQMKHDAVPGGSVLSQTQAGVGKHPPRIL